MKSKSDKKEEAIIRQKNYDRLSLNEKITKLDKKFGKDTGAKKKRAELKKQLEKK